MRIPTKRVEEIVETCHPGGSYDPVRIMEYANLAADLLDARRKIEEYASLATDLRNVRRRVEEMERDAEAAERALSTLRGPARLMGMSKTKPMSDERLEELRHMVKNLGRLDTNHGLTYGSIFDKEVRECVQEIDRLRRLVGRHLIHHHVCEWCEM